VLAPILVLVALVSSRADAADSAWSAYLAPSGACVAADDASASTAQQVRAVTCLVNWARAQRGHSGLARRAPLQRAAEVKGLRVASCGQLSHTPCGSAVTAAVNAAGYRYGWFGENLYAGAWGHVTARSVVGAWLASPQHRANILRRQFRHVGVAPVRANGLLGNADAVVWTATFASPRR
jgi:uncharacterized protein YkwD